MDILRMISVTHSTSKCWRRCRNDGRLTNQQLADLVGLSPRNARGGGCGWTGEGHFAATTPTSPAEALGF
jgi:hypothetical protein